MLDLTDRIIAYEDGELDYDEFLELFQELVNTGLAWQLQGHYDRMAKYLLIRASSRAPILPYCKECFKARSSFAAVICA